MKALLVFAIVLATTPLRAEPVRGRGVYYLEGRVPTPLAGVGERPAGAATRVALDDDHTSFSVDPRAARILLTNDQPYAREQIVADVLMLGVGKTADGAQVPVSAHLEVRKKGNTFGTTVHQHPTVPDCIAEVRFEPYTVVLRSGEREVVALTPVQAVEAVRSPGLGLRLASLFIQARDNVDGSDSRVLADVTFSVGIGGLSKKLVRARILFLEGVPDRSRPLADLVQEGVWELQIIALSDINPEEFRRDFFLVGMEGLRVAEPLARTGLPKGEALIIRLRRGHGTVFALGAQAPLPRALDVARAYLEFTGVGALVTQQARSRLGR